MVSRIDATAPPAELRLGKKVFRLSPMTDEDIAYLDQWVQQRHIRIARLSVVDADDEQKEMTERIALQAASSMSFMSGVGAHTISTVEGWSQIMWCGIRKNHPNSSPTELQQLLLDPDNLDALQEQWEELNTGQRTRARKPSADSKKKKAARKTATRSRARNRR